MTATAEKDSSILISSDNATFVSHTQHRALYAKLAPHYLFNGRVLHEKPISTPTKSRLKSVNIGILFAGLSNLKWHKQNAESRPDENVIFIHTQWQHKKKLALQSL